MISDLNSIHNSITFSVTSAEKSFSSKTNVLKIPNFTTKIPFDISLRSKELSRERKAKHVYNKNSLTRRFAKIYRDSAHKLGTEVTFGVFDRVAEEMSGREYNAMIGVNLELAERSHDLEYALDHIGKAFELLKSMRDRGFSIEERVYGPFLDYLISMDMVEEFHNFKDVIREASPPSVERLGYYEMLLWIQLGDGEKIEELCSTIDGNNGESLSILQGKQYSFLRTLVLCFLSYFEKINLFGPYIQKIICLRYVRKTRRIIFRGS